MCFPRPPPPPPLVIVVMFVSLSSVLIDHSSLPFCSIQFDHKRYLTDPPPPPPPSSIRVSIHLFFSSVFSSIIATPSFRVVVVLQWPINVWTTTPTTRLQPSCLAGRTEWLAVCVCLASPRSVAVGGRDRRRLTIYLAFTTLVNYSTNNNTLCWACLNSHMLVDRIPLRTPSPADLVASLSDPSFPTLFSWCPLADGGGRCLASHVDRFEVK